MVSTERINYAPKPALARKGMVTHFKLSLHIVEEAYYAKSPPTTNRHIIQSAMPCPFKIF